MSATGGGDVSADKVPTRASVHDEVASALGLDEVPPDVDLFELGLDSFVAIQLAARWRRSGVRVTVEQLTSAATLAEWVQLLGADTENADGPDESAPFSLSAMQRAYLVGRGDGQPYGGVAAHYYVELDGTGLDVGRLQAAYDRVVARHPMLRARIDEAGVARPASSTGLPEIRTADLSGLSAAERAARLAATRARLENARRDLARGEMIELAVSLLPDGAHRIHLDVDMIAADAWAFGVLLEDLARGYADPGGPSAEPSHTPGEFRAAQDEFRGAAREEDSAWWAGWIDAHPDLPSAPALPLREDGDGEGARLLRCHDRLDTETSSPRLPR
ncbi:phosphopantetheine-binding protein [Amycolatopsis sp. A1MSW2902]|uniref:phosphopantetheine-binding protein n=1 Tax=Amycolatopsis sp. A1MSW2902 TaxID=687413 RepID=UPI00307F3F29